MERKNKIILIVLSILLIGGFFISPINNLERGDFSKVQFKHDDNYVYNYIYNSIDPAVTSELNVYPNEEIEITYTVRSKVTRDYKREIRTLIDDEQVHLTEVTLHPENTITYDYYSETFTITTPSEIGEHTITHSDYAWQEVNGEYVWWLKDGRTYTFNVIEDPNTVDTNTVDTNTTEDTNTTDTTEDTNTTDTTENTNTTDTIDENESTNLLDNEPETDIPKLTEIFDDDKTTDTQTVVENSRESDNDNTIIIVAIILGLSIFGSVYLISKRKK